MTTSRSLLYREILPFVAMIAVECANVGLSTLFKAASLKGFSFYIFILYTNALGALVLFPFAFISYRRSNLPPLSYSILPKMFYLGFLGMLADICGYKGIEYSSPTLSSAISNLTPAFIFILAVSFRMEKVTLKSYTSLAKIAGTIIAISGAFIVVLYKGSAIILGDNSLQSVVVVAYKSSLPLSDWVLGGLLLSASHLSLSFWYIIQVQTLKAYPVKFVVVFLYTTSTTLMVAPVCMVAERNLSAWKITNKTVLIATVYGGLIGCLFGSTVHTWGLHMKGPVYIALFKPLSIVIAAAMGVSFLGETLSTGTLIGAIIISIGFYIAIWGKAKEENCIQKDDRIANVTAERLPLLRNE